MSARNTLKQKATRREQRAQSGRDADYQFTDVAAQEEKLTGYHRHEQGVNNTLKEKYGIVRPIWDLNLAIANMANRIQKFLKGSSKYSPHQGKQEIARRLNNLQGA
jgi:hypothetical protein